MKTPYYTIRTIYDKRSITETDFEMCYFAERHFKNEVRYFLKNKKNGVVEWLKVNSNIENIRTIEKITEQKIDRFEQESEGKH